LTSNCEDKPYSFYRRRVRRLVKGLSSCSTTKQKGSLTKQQNLLRNKIRAWEEVLPIYIPRLLQYRSDQEKSNGLPLDSHNHPENSEIWLPSHIPMPARSCICVPGLAEIEKKLCLAQCHDALDSI